MKDDKKSIVKEALVDYKDIQEAADANAKKRLADEFPKEFSNILKEDLNKNKPAKESKKEDDAEANKEFDIAVSLGFSKSDLDKVILNHKK